MDVHTVVHLSTGRSTAKVRNALSRRGEELRRCEGVSEANLGSLARVGGPELLPGPLMPSMRLLRM